MAFGCGFPFFLFASQKGGYQLREKKHRKQDNQNNTKQTTIYIYITKTKQPDLQKPILDISSLVPKEQRARSNGSHPKRPRLQGPRAVRGTDRLKRPRGWAGAVGLRVCGGVVSSSFFLGSPSLGRRFLLARGGSLLSFGGALLNQGGFVLPPIVLPSKSAPFSRLQGNTTQFLALIAPRNGQNHDSGVEGNPPFCGSQT